MGATSTIKVYKTEYTFHFWFKSSKWEKSSKYISHHVFFFFGCFVFNEEHFHQHFGTYYLIYRCYTEEFTEWGKWKSQNAENSHNNKKTNITQYCPPPPKSLLQLRLKGPLSLLIPCLGSLSSKVLTKWDMNLLENVSMIEHA